MLGISLLLPLYSRAQALPEPDAPPQGTRAAERHGPPQSAEGPSLPIIVTTQRGMPVKTLAPSDCVLTLRGRPVPIRKLTANGEQPRTFALLLDTAGSAQATFAAEQQAASAIADRLRPHDEAMLVAFDTDITLLADFTGHLAALDTAIQAAPINASVGHFTTGTLPPIGKVDGALQDDAVHLAVQRLALESGRRVLVLIGNGVDEGSRIRLHPVIREAEQSDVTIYGLLVHDAGVDELMEVNGKGPMRQLAKSTGGEVYSVDARGKGLKPAIQAIEQQLAAGWRVQLPDSTSPPGKPQPVRIACRRDGAVLKVQAPTAIGSRAY